MMNSVDLQACISESLEHLTPIQYANGYDEYLVRRMLH